VDVNKVATDQFVGVKHFIGTLICANYWKYMWIKTYAVVPLDYIKVRITHITNFLIIVRDIILSHVLVLVFFHSSKVFVPEVSLGTKISPIFIRLIGMQAT